MCSQNWPLNLTHLIHIGQDRPPPSSSPPLSFPPYLSLLLSFFFTLISRYHHPHLPCSLLIPRSVCHVVCGFVSCILNVQQSEDRPDYLIHSLFSLLNKTHTERDSFNPKTQSAYVFYTTHSNMNFCDVSISWSGRSGWLVLKGFWPLVSLRNKLADKLNISLARLENQVILVN